MQNGMVVGFHLGRLDGEKVAVTLETRHKRALLAVFSGLEPEYNCASDCRASATHNVSYPCPTLRNPHRSCSHGVFEPVEFSACESARNVSCVADAAAADLARLKNSLRAESGRLSATIGNLSDNLNATRARSAQLRSNVGSLLTTLVETRGAVSSLRQNAAAIETKASQMMASLPSITQAINGAKQLELSAINEKAKITVNVASLGAEIASSAKEVQGNLAKIDDLKGSLASSETNIAKFQQKIALAQPILAGSKAVVSIAQSIKAPLVKSEQDVATDLSARGLGSAIFADLGHLITPEMKVFFHVVAVDLVDTYHLLRNPKSILDGHPGQTQLPPDASFILNQRMCLQRASARAEAYKSAIVGLDLASWPGKVPQIGLADLANASRVVAKQVQALQAGVAEIALNDSCVGLGFETPLKEALTDATEWSQWTSKLRLSLITQSM